MNTTARIAAPALTTTNLSPTKLSTAQAALVAKKYAELTPDEKITIKDLLRQVTTTTAAPTTTTKTSTTASTTTTKATTTTTSADATTTKKGDKSSSLALTLNSLLLFILTH